MAREKCNFSVWRVVGFMLCAHLAWAQPGHHGYTHVEISVLDAEGKPIPKFEMRVNGSLNGSPQINMWKSYSNGVAVPSIHDMHYSEENQSAGAEQVIEIKAPGQSPVSFPLPLPVPESRKFEHTIQMTAGQKVSLVIQDHRGNPLPPDTRILPYTPDDEKLALMSMQNADANQRASYCRLPFEIEKSGQISTTIPAHEPQFHVLIDDERVMRGCVLGPFAADQTTQTVTLPEPARLTVSMSYPKALGTPPYDHCYNRLMKKVEGTDAHAFLILDSDLKSDFKTSETMVQPGEYVATVGTYSKAPRTQRLEGVDPSRFRDSRTLKLDPGQHIDVEFEYKPFVADSWKGDRDIEVEVKKSDGSAGAGIPYQLVFQNLNFGPETVATGITPPSGVIAFEGLRAGIGEEPMHYMLSLDDRKGVLPIQLKQDVPEKQFKLLVSPQVGEAAPDIELEDLFGGERVRLEQFRGKIVYIDFWASWCGPCQQPMAKLQKEWVAQKDAWEGKVVVFGASIDDKIETIRNHVTRNGWTKTNQYWCPLGDAPRGFQSLAAKAYGITGIPTALIIDGEGIIRWRGHPSAIDLKEKIEEMIGKGN